MPHGTFRLSWTGGGSANMPPTARGNVITGEFYLSNFKRHSAAHHNLLNFLKGSSSSMLTRGDGASLSQLSLGVPTRGVLRFLLASKKPRWRFPPAGPLAEHDQLLRQCGLIKIKLLVDVLAGEHGWLHGNDPGVTPESCDGAHQLRHFRSR